MYLLDYAKITICEYPSLYLFPDFNSCFIRVLDQVFGSIGSHCEWAQTKNPKDGGYVCIPHYSKRRGEYIRKLDKPYGKEKFKKVFSLCLDQSTIEKNLTFISHFYKESFDFNCWVPYPYFEKEYSLLWKDEVKYIQEDWKVGALWWLKECKRYFSDDRVKTYNYFPSEKNIKGLEVSVKTCLFTGEHKNIEEVNKSYKVDCFTGENFEELANARWEKEISEINNFIEETEIRLLSL